MNPTKRILLITQVLPWPLRKNGGSQRTELLRRALAKWGTVDVVGVGAKELFEVNNPPTEAQLRDAGAIKCFALDRVAARSRLPGALGRFASLIDGYLSRYRADAEVAGWLASRLRETKYDLIVVRYLAAGLQAGIEHIRSVPMVLDFDDIDWQTLATRLHDQPWPGVKGKIGSAIVLGKITGRCKRSLKLFKRVWVTSEEDAALLPPGTTTVLPNIPFAEANAPLDPLPFADGKEILFLGDLQFGPNRGGLDRFLVNIWPTVRAAVPHATLRIVGRGMTDVQKARWSQVAGVDAVGAVDSVRDSYARCAFSIVPIYFGGGTKIKVLETLAMGRSAVVTPHTLRGYASLAENGKALCIAERDEDFAAACIAMLNDPPRRNAMSAAGRDVVTREFSFEQFQTIIDESIGEIGRGVSAD